MLPDAYLIHFLDISYTRQLEQYHHLLNMIRDEEMEGTVIEKEMMKSFPDIDEEKKVRAMLYKLETIGLVNGTKKKIDGVYPPPWFYKCDNNESTEALLIKQAMESQMIKVDTLRERFIDNNFIFYCKNRCNPKLYTLDQVEGKLKIKVDGEFKRICPFCKKESIVMMRDDQKKGTIISFVFRLPSFIDKEKVVIDLFNDLFPHDDVPRIPEPAPLQLKPTIVEFTEEELDFESAISMLDYITPNDLDDGIDVYRVEEMEEDDVKVEILPEPQPEPEPAPVLHPAPLMRKLKGEMTYFTVDNVNEMGVEDLLYECLRRWIVATKITFDTLRDLGNQRTGRLQAFSLKKFFFCDSMGKKYLGIVLVGKPDRKINKKLGDVFCLMEKEKLFRIMSYHPRFEPKGVDLFMQMCENGEVYGYNEHEEIIKESLDAFNKWRKRTPKKEPVKGTVKEHRDAPDQMPVLQSMMKKQISSGAVTTTDISPGNMVGETSIEAGDLKNRFESI